MNFSDRLYIDINLGNECNFRCKYCYEDIMEERIGSLSLETLNNVFIFLDKLLHKTNKQLMLAMWGGEPLLHFDVLEKILKYYKNNNRVHTLIYTNGSLLHNYIDKLEEYKQHLSIQLSYDFEPCNIKNRVYDNKDLSKTVRNNLKVIIQRGFDCWAKSTMTLQDLSENLYDVFLDYRDFIKETNSNINLLITPDTFMYKNTILDFNAIENQLKKLLKYFYKNKLGDNTGLMWFDRASKALCYTPKSGCLIDYDGRIYPCHGCSSMDDEHKLKYTYLDVNNISTDTEFIKKYLDYLDNFDLTEPKECQECNNIVCFKCNAHNSILTTYDLSGWNNKNDDMICKLYTLLSKYVYAYKKLLNKIKEKNNG